MIPGIFCLSQERNKLVLTRAITSLVTTSTSDGKKIANPKTLNKLHKKLRLARKSLTRKTKGSNNYQKARLKVARIQAKIKDSRLDYTHQRPYSIN
ncbi:transposase [Okeania sp. SIO2C9]|uniref:transposase n=1 Tax=Okeania sp. SIO2C9 TaxID=2607791 RepID=UPI00345DA9C4